MSPDLIKIFTLATVSFLVAILATPLLTHFLFKFKLGKQIRNDGTTPVFSKMHAGKEGTPTMGGILVWGTALFVAFVFWFLDRIVGLESFHLFNFITRRETLLPLGALLGASLVGLLDDYMDVRRKGPTGKGMRFRFKVFLYAAVAAVGAYWFYFKLGFSTVFVPGFGVIDLGIWFILFFILVVVATSFSVNQTDGLDGLAGGTLLLNFLVFAIISYFMGRPNLAAMISVICGGLLAFLWFNVYPARFFMGDTGSMGLGVILSIIAFLNNAVFIIPIAGIIFVIETLSFLIQVFSKKVFGKKIFLSTPIHHHFEAYGWPETKVTMRFWIITAVFALISVVLFFSFKM